MKEFVKFVCFMQRLIVIALHPHTSSIITKVFFVVKKGICGTGALELSDYEKIGARISKKLSAILFRIFGFRVMQTPEIFHAVPMFLEPPDSTSAICYVAGCYGVLAYFSDCAGAVRKHFELVKSLSGKNKTYFEKFSSMDSTVSIHVRRTDYLLAANGTPILNFEYYLYAIEEVKLHETNPV